MKVIVLITLGALLPFFAFGQPPAAEAPLGEILEGSLLKGGAGTVAPYDAARLKGVRLFLFYYGAGWSGASNRLNPQLIRIHKELKQKKVPVEFIYMSGDKTPEDLDAVIVRSEMPWPAVAFGKVDTVDAALRYGAVEIPTLVLYSADGRRLSDTYDAGEFVGPGRVIQDLYQLSGVTKRPTPDTADPNTQPPAGRTNSHSPSGTDFNSFFK